MDHLTGNGQDSLSQEAAPVARPFRDRCGEMARPNACPSLSSGRPISRLTVARRPLAKFPQCPDNACLSHLPAVLAQQQQANVGSDLVDGCARASRRNYPPAMNFGRPLTPTGGLPPSSMDQQQTDRTSAGSKTLAQRGVVIPLFPPRPTDADALDSVRTQPIPFASPASELNSTFSPRELSTENSKPRAKKHAATRPSLSDP